MPEEPEEHAMPVALLLRMPSCHLMLHAILSYGRGSTVCEHASMAPQAQVHHSTPRQHAMPHPSSPSQHALPSFLSAPRRMACSQLGQPLTRSGAVVATGKGRHLTR